MRETILKGILESGAVAVIRMTDAQKLMRVVEAVRVGGITAIEITMTTPDALGIIEQLARIFAHDDEMLLGVGSVLDGPAARHAIDAGARFVVSPVLKADVIEAGHRYDVPVIPGAFTPTEVQRAYEMGADIVKIFPASVLGVGFFEGVLAPMPHVRLMPTGGVTLANVRDWIQAGACAVGVGSALLDKLAIRDEHYAQITENARMLRCSIDAVQ